ncbi:MAG: GreA/GreB family elongation factor [Cyclobacteriaceae bacterium]|nr:GreA/GreB family elongation factor [Cyclobacteriaceae bacterium]
MSNISFKQKVYLHCIQVVEDKITIAKEAVEAARQSAVEEERSTAGDKYDTARAMSHINQGMFANQLSEVLKLKKVLGQISIDSQHSEVESGTLIKTSKSIYFIAVSLGIIKIDGKEIMVISPLSPIGQLMLNKKEGEEFVFNGSTIKIDQIY